MLAGEYDNPDICTPFDIHKLALTLLSGSYNRAAASVIINATYGKPSLTDDDDSLVKKNHALGKRITEAIIPLSYMVDVIPPLKYVPAGVAKWKREGLEWYKETTKMLRGFVRDVEDEMVCSPSDLFD